MCGIVGYIGPKRVVPLILDGLKRLDTAATIRPASPSSVTTAGSRSAARPASCAISKIIRVTPLDGVYGVGHTRWATHGRRRKKTRIHIGTAPARSSSCTTASSKTTST